MKIRFRLLAGSLIALAGALWTSAPAGAVQTTTWGIVAAPQGHGYRSAIDHAADGSTVHDAVIVFNRTAQPITIRLYVLGATYANGAYQFSSPTTGLAADTSLAARSVTLAAHEQARVPVTIHMPRGAKTATLAGIGAEATAVNDGALSIQQQLVVLIKANPSSHVVPAVVKDVGLWGSIALVVLLIVAALAERERRRAKRTRAGPAFRPAVPSL